MPIKSRDWKGYKFNPMTSRRPIKVLLGEINMGVLHL